MQTHKKLTSWHNTQNFTSFTCRHSLLSGLRQIVITLLSAASIQQSLPAAINDAVISEGPHSLVTVVSLWNEFTGRNLLISPQVKGDILHFGPLTLKPELVGPVLTIMLTEHGYEIKEVAPNIDMIIPLQQKLISQQQTRVYVLQHISANDVVPNLTKMLSPSQTLTPKIDQPKKDRESNVNTTQPTGQLATAVIVAVTPSSIMVRGSEAELLLAEQFIQEADVLTKAVMIRAMIGQVTLGGQYQSGFDIMTALDDVTVSNVTSTNQTTSSQTQNKVAIPLKAPAKSLVIYGSVGSFSRYAKLLEEDSAFRVSSRPQLTVRSGGETTISSGQKIPYPQTTLTQNNGGASTSATIAYQDILLSMKIGATILTSGRIRLAITQKNDGVLNSVLIGGSQVPTISAQELVSEIEIGNGETIALGGIITDSSSNSDRGMKLLRKIPIIKNLFNSKSRTTQQSELIILIDAKIIIDK